MAKKSAIEELGISTAAAAGSGVLGGLVNQLFAGRNDKRQIRQQQKLTDMQVAANKQMADYEQELGLKMWKDTNYPAQIEMMKAAGLNPAAVLSNGGGGSGATGASAAGVGGGQAANAAQTQANQNELGLQMAQMQFYCSVVCVRLQIFVLSTPCNCLTTLHLSARLPLCRLFLW